MEDSIRPNGSGELIRLPGTSNQRLGKLYETLVALLIRQAGYAVKYTKESRDGGVDLIVFHPDIQDHPAFMIQCKNWAQGVGVDAVREVFAAKHRYRADYAVLVSASQPSADARQEADELSVSIRLVDLDGRVEQEIVPPPDMYAWPSPLLQRSTEPQAIQTRTIEATSIPVDQPVAFARLYRAYAAILIQRAGYAIQYGRLGDEEFILAFTPENSEAPALVVRCMVGAEPPSPSTVRDLFAAQHRLHGQSSILITSVEASKAAQVEASELGVLCRIMAEDGTVNGDLAPALTPTNPQNPIGPDATEPPRAAVPGSGESEGFAESRSFAPEGESSTEAPGSTAPKPNTPALIAIVIAGVFLVGIIVVHLFSARVAPPASSGPSAESETAVSLPNWAQSALGNTYVIGTSKSFVAVGQFITVPDGRGGTLSAVVGEEHGGNTGQQLLFLWHNQQFFGWDYVCMHDVIIAPDGDGIHVTYPALGESTTLTWIGSSTQLGASPDLQITCGQQQVVYQH